MSQENLINLSLDEESTVKRQDSLEFHNNPFDVLLKQAVDLDRDDPFEMCFKQANSTPDNVMTDKLLCFSEENSISESPPLIPLRNVNKMDGNLAASGASNSSACETPPTTSNAKKKSVDHRRRLLKLSLTNSVNSSPIVEGDSAEGTPSPVIADSNMFSEAFESMQSSRSSPSEDSFFDINSIKPDWLEADNSMDSDLEALCIPALRELQPSPLAEESANDSLKEKFEKFRDRMNSSENKDTPNKDDNKKHSPVLVELLRERVKQCKEQEEKDREQKSERSPEASKSCSSFDVSSLISSLKNIALECSTEQKRNIVDSLTSIFKDKDEAGEPSPQNLAAPPHPIIRQGTFDVELDDSREKSKTEEDDQINNQSPPPTEKDPEEDLCKTPENMNPDFDNIMEQIGKLLGKFY